METIATLIGLRKKNKQECCVFQNKCVSSYLEIKTEHPPCGILLFHNEDHELTGKDS